MTSPNPAPPTPTRYNFNTGDSIISPQQLRTLAQEGVTITSITVVYGGLLHLWIDTTRPSFDLAETIWRVFPHGDCLRAANVHLCRTEV